MAKTSFTKALAQKHILIPHINNYLEKGEFPDEWPIIIKPNKPRDDAFHPSGDCVPCARELYFKHKGEYEPYGKNTATSHKNFTVGHFWHAWLDWIVVEGLGFAQWEDVEREFAWVDEHWWAKGSADIAKVSVPGKGDYLVDWKTMNSRMFAMEATGSQLEPILWKYNLQCQFYMAQAGMDKTIIVGVEKDTPHNFREFVIDYEPALLEPVYEKWDAVSLALRTGALPDDDCEDCNVAHLV